MKRFYFIFLLCAMGCSSFNSADRWEGIRENRLRIYVRVTDEQVGDRDWDRFVEEQAALRARHILFSYVTRRLGEKALLLSSGIDGLVAESLKTGKTILREDRDEYQASYVEYDITTLQKELRRVEEQPAQEQAGENGTGGTR